MNTSSAFNDVIEEFHDEVGGSNQVVTDGQGQQSNFSYLIRPACELRDRAEQQGGLYVATTAPAATDGDSEELAELAEKPLYLIEPIFQLREPWHEHYCPDVMEFVRRMIQDRGKEKGKFNFVRAAVSIERNVDVYRRGVDFVYQLASEFFDKLSLTARKGRGQGGANTDEAEGGGEGMEEDGNEENVGKNVTVAQQRRKALPAIKSLIQRIAERQPRPQITFMPIAFTPMATYEKHDVAFYSQTDPNEVEGKKDDYRINTCFISEQGGAFVDPKNVELADRFSYMADCTFMRRPQHTLYSNLSKELTRPGSHQETTKGGETDWDQPTDFGVGVGEDDGLSAIADDVNMGFGEYPVGDLPAAANKENQSPSPADEPAGPRRSARQSQQQVGDDDWESQLIIADPYAEKRSEKSIPFKENRRCAIEAEKQVRARDKRIERECRAKGVPSHPTVKAYIDAMMFREPVRGRSAALSAFNSSLGDQALLSLTPLIHAEEKRREAIRRSRKGQKMDAVSSGKPRKSKGRSVAFADMEAPASPPPHQRVGNGSEDEDGPGGFEDPMEEFAAEEIMSRCYSNKDDQDLWMDDPAQLGDRLDENLNSSYGEERRKAAAKIMAAAVGQSSKLSTRRNYYDDTIYPDHGDLEYPDELPPRPLSQMEYEELLTYHLRKYWSTSEEKTTELHDRVQQWEEKMGPILEREREHRWFNIRDYGHHVVEKFSSGIGSQIDFTEVLEDEQGRKNDYELSRYLLVSLMLANTQNVEVVNNGGGEDAAGPSGDDGSSGKGGLQLKLLKEAMHYEVFEDEQQQIAGPAGTIGPA